MFLLHAYSEANENVRGEAVRADITRGGVVALGNFDGVHRGHQAVIGAAHAIARNRNSALGVVTFEPHPRLAFRPDLPPFRLTPAATKSRIMAGLGVDFLLLQPFDMEFAALSAREFVERVLVQALRVSHVVVGYDFVFGQGRRGNAAVLQELADEFGFGFTAIAPVLAEDGEVCTSTAIREALQTGHPGDAARLLGRPWEIDGVVEAGEALGRQLGFPTANLRLGDMQEPAVGVYAVTVRIGDSPESYPGAAYFGRRPTFGEGAPLFEVHLLDYMGDLYGKSLRVAIIDFVRGDQRFDGLDELKDQIALDCDSVRRLLRERPVEALS